MHCLGAVSGAEAAGPSVMASRGGVMSVVRALGVLVCEGRIPGPPRGYKEGPHCAAPLQPPVNDHTCDKDNYLCGRYLVLVREIAERISMGTSLCVEVLMCSDCPCGLARATCKDPTSLVTANTVTPWQHPSDILLEYWSVSVVPCKSPETMNSQNLYQAVRSRLHFSQVAAWWSRSNGTKPNYVTTRIVPYNDDNYRKFRESPIEHTFPLAGMGDGNSIKVTVWALPRMEEVPILNCPLHPIKDNDEECVARAITPTKNGPVPSSSHTAEALVLPVLVDDRLQTPCDKPGKHHCHCEDEDGCPPSPSPRPNGERKRRRSLPCGPPESSPSQSSSQFAPPHLPSVRETATITTHDSTLVPINSQNYFESSNYPSRNSRSDNERSQPPETTIAYETRSYTSHGVLELNFHSQINLDDNQDEGNDEKRYKPSPEILEINSPASSPIVTSGQIFPDTSTLRIHEKPTTEFYYEKSDDSQFYFEKLDNSQFDDNEKILRRCSNDVGEKSRHAGRETNIVINPFADKNFYHEPNPGPSSWFVDKRKKTNFANSTPCTVHQNYGRSSGGTPTAGNNARIVETTKNDVVKNCFATGKDLSNLMSKLTFPKEKTNSTIKTRDEGGIFDWFARVPGRVMSQPAPPTVIPKDHEKSNETPAKKNSQDVKSSNDVKLKNCNLELSQREFDEVLAVLRSRTPSARRRTPTKTIRRRERSERFVNDDNSRNHDEIVCPIHRNESQNHNFCACKICKKNEKTVKHVNDDKISITTNRVYRCTNVGNSKREISQIFDDEKNKQICVKSNERLQIVSNKADVLLGAILRTRERKGLSDISNGTIPRTNFSKNRENSTDDSTASTSRATDVDDEKSLPGVINKRLMRFKQLFKKECDNEQSPIAQTSFNDESTKNLVKKNIDDVNLKKNRVRRKIDLDEFCDDAAALETSSRSRDIFAKIVERDDNGKTCFGDNVNVCADDCGNLKSQGMNGVVAGDDDDDEDDDEACEKGVPSAIEQERFRRSLENAASMVFHSRTGLPLTSSPAPLRRGSCCFDYDSSLISVSSKRSALFELNTPPSPGAVSLEETDREIENSCEGDEETPKRSSTARGRPQSHALLGSFEESALNGRLEPVSTVHGFTAELGASGSFCPKHRKLPVTVFFYTLGDNDKVSTPYLAHINLGKKGYQVPRRGTIQVTLLNPLGTVVKMFVVLYDLSDMPPRSHTFLRQRTLRDKTLRYLVHLRFMSGKSGRIYLHTDIRMIICRKSDVDTASDFGSEPPKELRSYIHGPTNPKFSPRC